MITWNWCKFDELTPNQLYDILQLRELVFTISQECDEPDMDDVDRTALHFTGYSDHKLAAYVRVFQSGDKIKIGRAVVHPDHQGKGLGRELMQKAAAYVRQQFPGKVIEISAQYHLEKLFQSIGFQSIGDVYLEAGIKHIRMSMPA